MKSLTNVVLLAGFVASATLLTPGEAAAQPGLTAQQKQQKIRELQSQLARARTQASQADGFYRPALTAIASGIAACDRRDNVNNVAKAVGVGAGFFGPVGKLVKGAFNQTIRVTTSYDRLIASLQAGRLTNTRQELVFLQSQINSARLDAMDPWVRQQWSLIAQLRALGVRNP